MFQGTIAARLKQSQAAASLMQPDQKGLRVPIEVAAMWVSGAIMLGGIGLIAVVLRGRQRLQELAVQERIAMIERGMVPSPEKDPAGFDRLMTARHSQSRVAVRFQSAGVMIMGLGAALGFLLSFVTRMPGLGLGIGGALFVIGLTASLNGILLASNPGRTDPPRT